MRGVDKTYKYITLTETSVLRFTSSTYTFYLSLGSSFPFPYIMVLPARRHSDMQKVQVFKIHEKVESFFMPIIFHYQFVTHPCTKVQDGPKLTVA